MRSATHHAFAALLRASALALCFLALAACGASSAPVAHTDPAADRAAVAAVLDDWHAAAAASDEDRYFGHLSEDAIFLGTDASERWGPVAFRAYAHAPFAAQRGWHFRSIRRDVTVRGDVAWFDEDLDAVNLGPCRGSGVLVRGANGRWRIAQYNLAVTVPNARFAAVRELLRASPMPTAPDLTALRALLAPHASAQFDAGAQARGCPPDQSVGEYVAMLVHNGGEGDAPGDIHRLSGGCVSMPITSVRTPVDPPDDPAYWFCRIDAYSTDSAGESPWHYELRLRVRKADAAPDLQTLACPGAS